MKQITITKKFQLNHITCSSLAGPVRSQDLILFLNAEVKPTDSLLNQAPLFPQPLRIILFIPIDRLLDTVFLDSNGKGNFERHVVKFRGHPQKCAFCKCSLNLFSVVLILYLKAYAGFYFNILNCLIVKKDIQWSCHCC